MNSLARPLQQPAPSGATTRVTKAGSKMSAEARVERLGRLKKACADIESIFIVNLNSAK